MTTVDDYMLFQEALCKGESVLRRPTIELMRLEQLKGELRVCAETSEMHIII